MIELLNTVGSEYIFDLCVYFLLKVLTHSNTYKLDMLSVAQTSVKVGKEIVKKYLRVNKGDNDISYRERVKGFSKNNADLFELLEEDDTFFSLLGTKVMDILQFSDFIGIKVLSVARTEKISQYVITDDKLLSLSKKDVVQVSPLKLPMIVPPKLYNKTELGGYLLNDTEYQEIIFTDKKQYKQSSQIDEDNNLYYLVDNISRTPFKVNQDVLDFVISEKGKDLLLSDSDLTQYEQVENKTKYIQNKPKALVSKYVHQEFILKIASLFKNYSSIYFPVKLDHRGRLFCIPPYFNYQSSDLAKSLILFSEGGILNKNNLDCIVYLKCYGVNCFGGEISKGSIEQKES